MAAEPGRGRRRARRSRASSASGSPPGGLGRRAVVLIAASVLLGAALAAAILRLAPVAAAQEGAHPAGRIVIPRGQTLYVVDAATGSEQSVYTAADTQLVLDAALTPNGQQAVFSRLALARRDDPGGADVYRIPIAGGDPALVAAHDTPGATLTTPIVMPDGTSVLYTYTPYGLGLSGTDTLPRIERIPLEGGTSTVVAQEAEWPAPTPDGAEVAFIRRTSRGDALWIAASDGSNSRELIPPTRFLGLAYPRVSPDGTRIAVAATIDLPGPGGPGLPAPGNPALPATPGPSLPRTPFAWRAAGPNAHGLPWDLWSVARDGSDLRRLTQWYEDDPSLAWSPDGRWLAALGGSGLRVLDVASGRSEWLQRDPAFGAIDWARD